jgi:predicted metal-dependent phosphoesterase TrpH
VDLHLHTTASDGTLTPTQLIEQIGQTSLKTVAVTDHDSTSGVDEALQVAERYPEILVIPGIEFGSEIGESEVHLLGLFIDHHSPDLQQALEQFREQRVDAARRMVVRLGELGIDISWDRVQELAQGAVGRPHIARAMLEAGYVETVREAFDRYIGSGGPARIPRPKFEPVEALELVHAAGGVGVVAHPRTVTHLEEVLEPLAEAGLAGIEVYAEKYRVDHQEAYAQLAERYELVSCGGTDYHAFGSENEVEPGVSGPPPDTARKLYERALALHQGKPGFVPSRPL